MRQEKPLSVLRPTDDDARRLARILLRSAPFGAIAVLAPDPGHPFSSRVLVGTDIDGVAVMLCSTLAMHTRAVLADPRCSLLVGEPGKGDPLASPRLTILADAERVDRDSESHSILRKRFLRRHPKAAVYLDFPDFSLFRLPAKSASLNGGFGKAYHIAGGELVIQSPSMRDISHRELQLLGEINALHEGVGDLIASHFFKEKTVNWNLVGLDAAGLDLARKGRLLRFELDRPITDTNDVIAVYANILKAIRQN